MFGRLAPALTKAYARATRSTRLTDRAAMQALADRWTATAYANNHHWTVRWLGMPVLQLPNDLMIMQELIERTRPRVIVETGTFGGGTAIFYASMLSLLGDGRVISVDVNHSSETIAAVQGHAYGDRVTLITGDSAAPQTVSGVREAIGGEKAIMVALDSDHRAEHVLRELRAYADFVPAGGYLVVFDTIVRVLEAQEGAGLERGQSPLVAIEQFLRERPEFEVDASCDRLMVSFCPGGFLRRTR